MAGELNAGMFIIDIARFAGKTVGGQFTNRHGIAFFAIGQLHQGQFFLFQFFCLRFFDHLFLERGKNTAIVSGKIYKIVFQAFYRQP
jgi:hypothetical protein